MFDLISQAAQQAAPAVRTSPSLGDYVSNFFSSPQEMMWGYIVIMLVLWLIARRGRDRKKDFSAEAQRVLDEKFKKGELDRASYEKYRQELSMRLKKD